MAGQIPDESFNTLISKAKDAMQNAYAPYSGFMVGAALLLDNGAYITGSNQENAAYPLCMCAERVALYAKASFYPDARIQRMAIVAQKAGNDALVPATPCGSCRQVLVEFETRQGHAIEIIMLAEEHSWVMVSSAQSLLPHSFTGSNLSV